MYGAIDMLLSLFPIYMFSQVFFHLAFNRLTSKKLKIRKYCYRHSLCRISKQPASLLASTELEQEAIESVCRQFQDRADQLQSLSMMKLKVAKSQKFFSIFVTFIFKKNA